MSEGAQFILFCALQRMDAGVPNTTQIGGYFMGPGVNADHGAYSRLWRVSGVLAASGAP
jgi:hypothetical protein